MKRCRTKAGELRLRHEGQDYLLDANGLDLPDDLAESIRPHVNVVVEDVPAPPPEPARSFRRSKSEDSEG